MKIWAIFKKLLVENFRDWKILIFCLVFAPFFVLIMYFYFDGSRVTYKIILVNQDRGIIDQKKEEFKAGDELISLVKKQKSIFKNSEIIFQMEKSLDQALKKLEKKKADVVINIPPGFTRVLTGFNPQEQVKPVTVKTFGDHGNFKYILGAAYFDYLASRYVEEKTGQQSPVDLQAVPIRGKKSISELDKYIPALLILSIINLLFTAGGSIIREKDKNTIIRLRMSRMKTLEWMMGVNFSQIIIGIAAFGLTYLTALSIGYQAGGSFTLAMVIIFISSVSMVGISLLVAAFIRSVFDLMTVGCFPYFILLFFSGSMIPLPPVKLFSLGGFRVMVNELLPVTHSINALGKVLNYRAGLGDILYEIGAIIILSIIFFALGIFFFTRRHMRY